MSVLRRRFYRNNSHYNCRVPDQHFNSEEEILTVADENAAEMHVLVDRMKRGLTPSTHVAQYSSMICSDSAKLLDNPPLQINDPTDVPLDELNEISVENTDVENTDVELKTE